MRLASVFFLLVAVEVLDGRPAAASPAVAAPATAAPAEATPPAMGTTPPRLGPSASVAIGAGYSLVEGETGGVSVLALADVGWFVTDRFALLLGATLLNRPADESLHETMLRLGIEYRMDPRHYLRLTAGQSVLGRDRDELSEGGVETIGTGEGALLVAGVPAVSWRFGEMSFQVVAGAAYHHGEATKASYAAFIATCLEVAVR